MQTFLPFVDFETSAKVLDKKRLWKQVVEADQILSFLERKKTEDEVPYGNHPAVLMWEGYETALKFYRNVMLAESLLRGINTDKTPLEVVESVFIYPPWIGWESFHLSHRSNLLRKDAEHYQKYFAIKDTSLPYVWPVRKINGKIVRLK